MNSPGRLQTAEQTADNRVNVIWKLRKYLCFFKFIQSPSKQEQSFQGLHNAITTFFNSETFDPSDVSANSVSANSTDNSCFALFRYTFLYKVVLEIRFFFQTPFLSLKTQYGLSRSVFRYSKEALFIGGGDQPPSLHAFSMCSNYNRESALLTLGIFSFPCLQYLSFSFLLFFHVRSLILSTIICKEKNK